MCDEEVQYSRTGHLAQLVSNLKKQALSYTANTAKGGGSHQFIICIIYFCQITIEVLSYPSLP